jgi:hypothetical protein
MLPHPYLLDALYQARRRDELGTVEIDDRAYRAAGMRPVRATPLPRLPMRLGLHALVIRRQTPVRVASFAR